jgi:hypothetical protein
VASSNCKSKEGDFSPISAKLLADLRQTCRPDRPGVTSSSGGEFLDLADWVDLSRRPTQWRLAMARKTITLEIEAESEGLLSSTDADPECRPGR